MSKRDKRGGTPWRKPESLPPPSSIAPPVESSAKAGSAPQTISCRVWPHGELRHNGRRYAPGEIANFTPDVIASVGACLIPLE